LQFRFVQPAATVNTPMHHLGHIMSNPALAAVTAAEDAIDSSDPSYASSILDFPNAEAGPSNYASPSNPAGALQALAPVRASGQDEGSGVVMLPTAPNVFTDKQLDEYKEQDRYLPVSMPSKPR
jgi:hypothetical protein